MKKFTLASLAVCLFIGHQSFAQANIAAARAMGVGATVTVRGIVTNGSELGAPLRYLQDATAGIAAYSPSMLTTVNAGDSVSITGVLKDYNNLLEIDPVSNVTVLATSKPLPAPVQFSGPFTAAFAEQYEGMLVQLNSVGSITTTAGAAVSAFAGNTNYNLNGNSALQLRVNSASTGATGIVGKPAPTGSFSVIGIMSQFAAGGPSTTGYQLLPRLYSDFILGNTPNIISTPRAINITTTSFTVTFTTQNQGDTKVEYGTTPALGQNATSASQTTTHSLALTGLDPATAYYVRVSSTNANGTSTGNNVVMMTASNSSGRMQVYFNKPVDAAVAYQNNPATTLTNAIDDSVIAMVNRSKYTLDIMMYNWSNSGNISSIAAAVNAAKTRGVQVRVIYDGSTTSNAINQLNASIPRVERTVTPGIMHNKIVIMDVNSTDPNEPLVWTGSTNWTDGQINTDRNSAIIIQDQSLARAYTMEFNEMWGSATATPGTPKFGPAKADNTPHEFNIGGKRVELYFSPSDNTNTRLMETIGTANTDLEISSMLITRADLANAIKAVVQTNNIANCSGVILNDTVGATGPFMTIKSVLINRAQKYSGSGILHHKYMIVDATDPSSDPLVWTGSHNWSNNGNNNNDENSLVIHHPDIVNQYYQEWSQTMKNQNVAGVTACAAGISGISGSLGTPARLSVYPNPSQGSFTVQLPAACAHAFSIRVYDMTGRLMLEQQVAVSGVEQVQVQTGQVAKGLYSIQVTGAELFGTGRIVIE